MNSVDKRIEELLSRAGQTISDLPNGYLLNAGEAKDIQGVACRWFIDEDAPEGVALRNLVSIPLYQYILHLTDIIDRMETALENVCGERDYLRSLECGLCYSFRKCGADACEMCMIGEGVPEYRSVKS